MTRKPYGSPTAGEAGLRRLARSHRDPVTNLELALERSHESGASETKLEALRALVAGASPPLPPGTPREELAGRQARAIWAVIRGELDRVGRPEGERRRAALIAALHLDGDNTLPTISARLDAARERGHFGARANGQRHGDDALRKWWGNGVRLLGKLVEERLDYLADHPAEWREYTRAAPPENGQLLRPPRPGAQPFVVDFFLATVFMRDRFVERRITERIVTARAPVSHYVARGFGVGDTLKRIYVPIRALWGCQAEPIYEDGVEVATRLMFPKPLAVGERAHFASEVEPAAYQVQDERSWINVDIDHHGIRSGSVAQDGLIPTGGLTIRIRFDDSCLPTAAWWYAELPDPSHRYNRPPAGDPRLLPIVGGAVQRTFVEGPCHPGEHYGIGFRWPRR